MKKYEVLLFDVDGTLLDFMDAMDICSIFGNALDNAIEAVMKIKDKEKRLIHITISQVKSFVMIRIQNYKYMSKLKKTTNLPNANQKETSDNLILLSKCIHKCVCIFHTSHSIT